MWKEDLEWLSKINDSPFGDIFRIYIKDSNGISTDGVRMHGIRLSDLEEMPVKLDKALKIMHKGEVEKSVNLNCQYLLDILQGMTTNTIHLNLIDLDGKMIVHIKDDNEHEAYLMSRYEESK